MRPDVHHITNGRDHDNTEWTLCGIRADWDEVKPMRDEWCQECVERDG